MAEKKIVGVRYSEEVNADLFIDPATNQPTKAVNNVNGQEIGGGGGDFSIANVTFVTEESIIPIAGAWVSEVPISPSESVDGTVFAPPTLESPAKIALYKGNAFIQMGDIVVVNTTSGNIEQVSGRTYRITGDCTIDFHQEK